MKALHVIPAVAPRYGGPSEAVVALCRALPAHEVTALIATTDADGAGALAVDLDVETAYRGVPAIFFHRQWSEAVKYSSRLARWLHANVARFDVVHVHAVFSHACFAAAVACRRHRVPYIVRPLGTLDPWSLGQKRWRKRLAWHLGAARMLRSAAAVHYTTAEERRVAESALGLDGGVVIPLGVGDDVLAPAGSAPGSEWCPELSGAPYVLAMCRLHPKKRLEALLEAFCDVIRRPEAGSVCLVVAGDGDAGYVQSLRRLVIDRGADKRVVFPGWLHGETKLAALRGARVFALLSHQENFSVATVEAMACAVPVIVSAGVNLAPHIDEAAAGWVAPWEPARLAPALALALGDEAECRRRGRAGRELVLRSYTWPKVAEATAALYRSLGRAGGAR